MPMLLDHLKGKSQGRFPVWMMRQAGRYQASYRELRKTHGFWDMVTKPEVTAQVTLLPRDEMPVDAVILFSDILTLPFGHGVPVEIRESIGPVVEPSFSLKDFHRFDDFEGAKHTPFVGEALTRIRDTVDGDVTVIGFAGAPWTVGAYLGEGMLKKKRFEHLKGWMARDPEGLAESLGKLGAATARYLTYQLQSGADVVQLFDTWVGEMPRDFYRKFYGPLLAGIFAEVKKVGPVIYFARHAHHLAGDMASLEVDAMGVDSLLSLGEWNTVYDGRFSLQGNLEPEVLLGSEAQVREATRQLVQQARELPRPAVLNLGHGIFPNTPQANVLAFVEEASRPWT